MSFIANLGYILLGLIAIVSVFLLILALLEKKLHVRFLRGQYARNEWYIKKVAKLNVNTPIESMRQLNKLAKMFFNEAFHLKGNPEYSELEAYFQRKNNKKATQFCREMTHLMYSKEKPTKEKLQELIKIVAEIISANKIISKEKKAELDKKSQKKEPTTFKSILEKVRK